MLESAGKRERVRSMTEVDYYHEGNIGVIALKQERQLEKLYVWVAIQYQDYEPGGQWGVFFNEADAVAKIRQLQGDDYSADEWLVIEFEVEGDRL